VNIRKVSSKDAEGILEFVRTCPPLGKHTLFTYWLFCNYFSDTCYIGEIENEIVAICTGFRSTSNPQIYYLWQLGVKDSLRKKGYALALITRSFNRAKDLGCSFFQFSIEPGLVASEASFYRFARNIGKEIEQIDSIRLVDFPEGKKIDDRLFQIRMTSV